MAVVYNLYPGVVDTFMPAFLINSDIENKNICRVYFSLSLFNTTSQIKNCQVTVRNQSTNLSALNPDKYPSEVMITDLKVDDNRTTDDKYYIEIKPSDMINNNFIIDQYYKVQIRFTGIEAEDAPISADNQPIDEWLANNLMHFSEWSTVCLIRGISVPTLTLQEYEQNETTDIENSMANISVVGQVNFAEEDETETLRSYNVKLYDSDNNLLLKSDELYTSDFANVNQVNYQINYSLETNKDYRFEVTFTTQNLYTETNNFNVHINQAKVENLYAIVRAWAEDEDGRVVVKINRPTAYPAFTGQIILRRTDSKSNFKVWEDIFTKSYDGTTYIDETWYDYTLESGIWYKYAVQGIDSTGVRMPMISFKNPIMLVLDHAFLYSNGEQLKIRFNPQIGSFNINISESRTDTIGSPYPFITRNGDVHYAIFPISGTISSEMDDDNIFTTKDDLYGENKSYYENYNELNNIPDNQDYVYEKFFRDKVIKFLYSGRAMLFRSATEGNILVRLMDISFQPNQTLGRRLWDFSATAYEIDECTIANYKKYGIYKTEDNENKVNNSNTDLILIKNIIFINPNEQPPEKGKSNILYINDNKVYIWNKDDKKYQIVSIPVKIITNDLIKTAEANELFTDRTHLYKWDSAASAYEEISGD